MVDNEAFRRTKDISRRFGIGPQDSGTPDSDHIRAAMEAYLDSAAEAVNIPEIPPYGDGAPVKDILRIPVGRHRDGTSQHAGGERILGLYPYRIRMSDEDARIAGGWATKQLVHYPPEGNAARRIAGVHTIYGRVEWGKNPDAPYEVDTEPSGVGLMPHLSSGIRTAFVNHRAALSSHVWTAMPSDRMGDSFEHFGAPLVTTENLTAPPTENSGLILPFMRSKDDLPKAWWPQSILPVHHMEDKAHMVDMGLFEKIPSGDHEALAGLRRQVAEEGKPMVLRGLVGSCAVGLSIYGGGPGQRQLIEGKPLKGTVSQTRFMREAEAIVAETDLLVRDYAPPFTLDSIGVKFSRNDENTFGPPDVMCAIKRYFVGFYPDGSPHVLGGLITARPRTALIHGANDAVNIVVDPPEAV